MYNFLRKLFKTEPTINQTTIYSTDPIEIVNKLTDNKFKWFDYSELPLEERIKYYNAAQEVLKNIAMVNEIAALNADFMEWAAKKSQNYDGLLAMRYQISGLNLLEERLKSIPDPTTKELKAEYPHEAI